jgi:hypothetical protein
MKRIKPRATIYHTASLYSFLPLSPFFGYNAPRSHMRQGRKRSEKIAMQMQGQHLAFRKEKRTGASKKMAFSKSISRAKAKGTQSYLTKKRGHTALAVSWPLHKRGGYATISA